MIVRQQRKAFRMELAGEDRPAFMFIGFDDALWRKSGRFQAGRQLMHRLMMRAVHAEPGAKQAMQDGTRHGFHIMTQRAVKMNEAQLLRRILIDRPTQQGV